MYNLIIVLFILTKPATKR